MSRESITIKIFQHKMKIIVLQEPYNFMLMRLKMILDYISSTKEVIINTEFHFR
jgi:hypothetical protein